MQIAHGSRSKGRRLVCPIAAFHIDQRWHMDNALRRQQQEEHEAQTVGRHGYNSKLPTCQELYHVKTLHLLDTLLEATAQNTLVAIAAYSTSCGIYKSFLEVAQCVRDEEQERNGSVVFVRHDVSTEYDGPSDISQLYRIKSVPMILLLNRDGAVVDTTRPIASIRQRYRQRDRIEHELNDMKHSLKSMISHHQAM